MIQLVVPPRQSGGVYDFSCKLQEAIGQDPCAWCTFLKITPPDWKVGPDDSVVLQLSGYGFDKRGAPLWLLREMEKRRKHIRTFGVFFHELYAFGPPWSSSFWLSPRATPHCPPVGRTFGFLDDQPRRFCPMAAHFAGAKPHAVLPVFSTIGETGLGWPTGAVAKDGVFGSPGLRQATYQAAGDKLFAWARRPSLEIHDIGAPIADAQLADTLRANGVVLHGRLADEAVRAVMQDALFGLLAYPVEYVAKSSVFAAYCAHGICPVLISSNYDAGGWFDGGQSLSAGVPMLGIAIASCSDWAGGLGVVSAASACSCIADAVRRLTKWVE